MTQGVASFLEGFSLRDKEQTEERAIEDLDKGTATMQEATRKVAEPKEKQESLQKQ